MLHRAARALRQVLILAALAWAIACSSTVAGMWLMFLDADNARADASTIWRALLEFLWLSAKWSEDLIGLARTSWHEPIDVLASLIVHVQQAFLLTFTVLLVLSASRHAWRRHRHRCNPVHGARLEEKFTSSS